MNQILYSQQKFMQLWYKLIFLFLLKIVLQNLVKSLEYDFGMPEEDEEDSSLDGIELEKFINLPFNFGAHQQLRVKPFQNRIASLKYTFSRMGKYSRSLPYNGAKARKMPCCTETIGTHTCNELRNKRPLAFRKRCKVDADFAILQCCQTCRTNIAELGRELFAFGLKSRHCFDRHNRNYCSHFIHQSGMWAANAGKLVNCNGESASLAFRVCRRSCGFCDPKLYEKPNRNCTKGSGVNPTVKGGEKQRGDGKKERGEKKATEKAIEKGTTKNGSSTSPLPTSSIQTTLISTNKPSSTSISTATITSAAISKNSTTKMPSTKDLSPPSPKPHSPSAPPPTIPPTLHSTVLPPTTPKLLPCPPPSPLPSLPQIPCRPIEPIVPLIEPTISVPQITPRPFVPNPPPPLPPIHPIMPPPYPHRPLPLPGWPIHPIHPRPFTRPKPRPMPTPQRPAPKITIEWKPMPPPRGVEVGPWPEWPWPFPDEVIEAILNHLSGVDDANRIIRGKINGRRGGDECEECVFDEIAQRMEVDEPIGKEEEEDEEHLDLTDLVGFSSEKENEINSNERREKEIDDILNLLQNI